MQQASLDKLHHPQGFLSLSQKRRHQGHHPRLDRHLFDGACPRGGDVYPQSLSRRAGDRRAQTYRQRLCAGAGDQQQERQRLHADWARRRGGRSADGAVAQEFEVPKRRQILVSCTGVIGRPLPVERILGGMAGLQGGRAQRVRGSGGGGLEGDPDHRQAAEVRFGSASATWSSRATRKAPA